MISGHLGAAEQAETTHSTDILSRYAAVKANVFAAYSWSRHTHSRLMNIYVEYDSGNLMGVRYSFTF